MARFFSYVLHPLMMPFYAVALLFHYNTYLSYTIAPVVQRIIFIIVFLTTFAMPAITSILLLKRGSIQSLEMESIGERTIPFITTAGYYFICFLLLRQLPVPRLFSTLVLGAAISIVLAFVINRSWKISIHMIGIGGIVGSLLALTQILVADLMLPLIISILFAGVLGSARLVREAHSPAQIYAGFFIGVLVEWVLIGMMQA